MAIEIVPSPSGSRAADSDDGAAAQGDGAGDQQKELVVRLSISSNVPIRRWFGREILAHTKAAIDTSYLDAGMSALIEHTPGRILGLGYVRNWEIDEKAGKLVGDVVFDADDAEAVRVHGKVMRKFIRHVSVGYSIERYALIEQDEQEGNTYEAQRWTPLEMSFVDVPADITVGAGRSSDGTLRRIPIELPEPAIEARSTTVPAPVPAAAAATTEPTREQRLAEMATEHNRSADLPAWIISGRSFEDIQREVLASYAARAAAPAAPASTPATVTGVHDRAADKPWEEFGDFLGAVVRAGKPHGTTDPRLTRAATGAGVESGSDGGFLIPPGFATAIQSRAEEIGQIWSRVRKVPVQGNTMTIAGVDESSRANGSRWGGVSVGRVGEGDTITGGKPKYHQVALKLKKLMGLYYLSEEQMEDGPAAASIGIDAFAEELAFVTENEVINGNGGAQMLGILNSGALVTQTKVSGQAADTVVAGNITAMASRLNSRSRATAVWVIDPSVEQQLPLMTIGDQPIYIPQGSLRGSPDFALLLGMPVLRAVEYLAKLGDAGDIMLCDFSQYVAIEKGTKVAQSMHARFVNDEQVIKFTTRNDGAPLWKQPLTPLNGGPTRSPFITLEART